MKAECEMYACVDTLFELDVLYTFTLEHLFFNKVVRLN